MISRFRTSAVYKATSNTLLKRFDSGVKGWFGIGGQNRFDFKPKSKSDSTKPEESDGALQGIKKMLESSANITNQKVPSDWLKGKLQDASKNNERAAATATTIYNDVFKVVSTEWNSKNFQKFGLLPSFAIMGEKLLEPLLHNFESGIIKILSSNKAITEKFDKTTIERIAAECRKAFMEAISGGTPSEKAKPIQTKTQPQREKSERNKDVFFDIVADTVSDHFEVTIRQLLQAPSGDGTSAVIDEVVVETLTEGFSDGLMDLLSSLIDF